MATSFATDQSGTPNAASSKFTRFMMVEGNLTLLLQQARNDPESYKEEYGDQLQYYLQTMKLLHIQPDQHRLDVDPLFECITYLANLAHLYRPQAKTFAEHLIRILREQAPGLDPVVRLSFCKAMVCLRGKNVVDPIETTDLFFELVKVEDKHLRKFLLGSIIMLFKKIYKKRNSRLLVKLQKFCINKLKDSRSIVARASQLVLIDAFRKKYCRDAKTVNAIADCCFHKLPKIQVTAMKFFIGTKENEEGVEEVESTDDEEGEDNSKTLKQVMLAFKSAKKTRKRVKDLAKAKKEVSGSSKKKKEARSKECNLLAIRLINDPQEFSDRLFGMLSQKKKVDRFEVRLFRIALIARLSGIHRLQTLGFFSFLHRYLQPKQKDVTRVLLYAAQACHDLIPPDTVEQLVHCIAQNFISDKNSPEAMTVGINAVREILTNCPFAATEDLLRDLAEYKSYKNKNVSMAARSLIALVRTINPKLLKKKDRGRIVNTGGEELEPREFIAFGAPAVYSSVPGAECLDENAVEAGVHPSQFKKYVEDDEEEIDFDEIDPDDEDESEESSGDDEGWHDVEPEKKRKRKSATGAETPKKKRKSMDSTLNSSKGETTGDDEWEEDEEDDEEEVCGVDELSDDDEGEGEDDQDEGDSEDGEESEGDEDDQGDEEEEEEDGDEVVESDTSDDSVEARKVGKRKLTKKQIKQATTNVHEDVREKASKISSERILSQEEFKQIRIHQIKKQIMGTKKLYRDGKRKENMSNSDRQIEMEVLEKLNQRESGDGLPRLNVIEQFHKKIKENKEQRLARVEEGREGRGEFGKPKKTGEHVGRTNREVAKNKVYKMVQHKVRGENRQRSFRDQQKSLRAYLMKQHGKK